MGQVTIYIDDETEKKMIASAKAKNVSKSRWVTEVIREKVAKEWPASWADFPSVAELRSDAGQDARREAL